ncbi:hypothetical protein N9Y26_00845 [bacterium]|nr:hypothetical protein [bacterium]
MEGFDEKRIKKILQLNWQCHVVEKKIFPHEIALNNLEVLNAKKLWQSGDVKTYHMMCLV